MGYDPNKVIDVAKSWVGYLEKKDGNINFLRDKKANAGYNNYTWFGYKMHQIAPDIMDYPAYWCDAFIDYCFWEAYGDAVAKKLLCGGYDDYTPSSAQKYKECGRWYSYPKAGDQIFFKNSERICHTGIVEKVENNRVYTIEGNTRESEQVVPNGGAVCKKSYPLNYDTIAGYGRPNYSLGSCYMFEVNTIRKGDEGQDVYLMQRLLRGMGYTMQNGRLLGLSKKFGDQTEFCLKNFQRKTAGLEVDGICGVQTWTKLINL